MLTTPLDLEHEFRAVLAGDGVRAAAGPDAVCGMQPRFVLEPATEQQLAAALRLSNDAGLAVIPRGGGTKLFWGNPPARADVILSTRRLNKIIEHVWADLTVSVEAGCTVQNLQAALAQHGQRLAADSLWPDNATVGGILSTNDSGALRLRFGALRDLIIGVTIALPDGTLAFSGGKVVKNVAGYDLPKLVTGALGTLGVITRAVFRLHPLPHHSRTLSLRCANLDSMQRVVSNVQDSNLAHTALQVRAARDSEPVLDILFEGTEAGIAAQESQLRALVSATAVDGVASASCFTIAEAPGSVWRSTQEQWSALESATIAKITALPANLARTIETVQRLTRLRQVHWRLVMQAIGLGCLHLSGTSENLHASLSELRIEFEASGDSLVVLHRPATMPPLDAWGQPSDAFPLMRAIKTQLDARGTLNLGRFVGNI